MHLSVEYLIELQTRGYYLGISVCSKYFPELFLDRAFSYALVKKLVPGSLRGEKVVSFHFEFPPL